MIQEIIQSHYYEDVANIIYDYLNKYEILEDLIPKRWSKILYEETKKKYFYNLKLNLLKESKKYTIYPLQRHIFRALELPPEKIKVVILGQDCYHGRNQAEGLSFSVQKGRKIPPSLRNIYKELETDIEGFKAPYHGHLGKWAEQGVLLLNASLTVREAKANSHKNFGWHTLTDYIIEYLSKNCKNIVFILWGGFARKKKKLIGKNHYVIESAHPSPLSARYGFFGSRPFSKCNEYLAKNNLDIIDWKNY